MPDTKTVKVDETVFVSLGGVWLDEIRRPGQPTAKNIVGGSATYAALGTRFFNTLRPTSVKLIINAGNDFPEPVIKRLQEWNVSLTVLVNAKKVSTRGILEHFITGGSRFTRLTPPLLTSPADVAAAEALHSQVFHMFAVPDLVQSQILQLKELREQAGITKRPIIIWEPHPKSCTPSMLKEHLAILHDSAITVFSPNNHELNAFFTDTASSFDKDEIEARARKFFNPPQHLQPQGPRLGVQVVIIRAAENGCLVIVRHHTRSLWLPAFWTAEHQEHVIDPTGAGNAFLGGLAAGWLETNDWYTAAAHGAVAASIIIEHVGPPTLKRTLHGDGSVTEHWGDVSPQDRLDDYLARPDVVEAIHDSRSASLSDPQQWRTSPPNRPPSQQYSSSSDLERYQLD